MEEHIVVLRAGTTLDHHDTVRALEVVAQRLGLADRTLLVRAGEQLLDEIPAGPHLGLGDAPHASELHGQHGGAVLQRDMLLLARRGRRVDQDQHADNVLAWASDRHEPATLADRTTLAQDMAEHLFPPGRRVLRVGLGTVGAGPGPQVAVAILDADGITGDLVHGVGDALLALAGHRDASQPVVDRGAALERPDRVSQHGVRGLQLLSRGPQFLGRSTFPRVQVGVAERHAGLLGEDLEQVQLVGRRLVLRAHHDVTHVALEAAKRERPAPGFALDRQRPTAASQHVELRFDLGAHLVACTGCVRRAPPALEQVQALEVATL